MAEPLPVAAKTGLAFAVPDPARRRQKAYDGGRFAGRGVGRLPVAAVAQFESLLADGFAALAVQLYGPVVAMDRRAR